MRTILRYKTHIIRSNSAKVGRRVGQPNDAHLIRLVKDFSCPWYYATQVLKDGTSTLCKMGRESFGGLL